MRSRNKSTQKKPLKTSSFKTLTLYGATYDASKLPIETGLVREGSDYCIFKERDLLHYIYGEALEFLNQKIIIAKIYNKKSISMDADLYITGYTTKELSDGLAGLYILNKVSSDSFQVDIYGQSYNYIN